MTTGIEEAGDLAGTTTTTMQTSCELVVDIDTAYEFVHVKIEIGYANTSGAFVSAGSDPACASLVGGAFDFHDNVEAHHLSAEWILPDGLNTPASLLKCRFNSGIGAPHAGDFSVWVSEAEGRDGEPVAKYLNWGWGRHCSVCGRPGCQCPELDPVAGQCAFILRAAVGIVPCHSCICDENGSGIITVVDALNCLHEAVGQDVVLACPVCLAP